MKVRLTDVLTPFCVFCFSLHDTSIMRFLLAAILVFSVPADRSQQKHPAHSKQPTAEQIETQPSITVLDNHYNSDQKKSAPTEQTEHWPPSRYSSFWPNWAFVVVGLGGTFAALLTLRAVREQAGHLRDQVQSLNRQVRLMRRTLIVSASAARSTRRSAESAKKSAQAAINAERAWVGVTLEEAGNRGHGQFMYKIKCTNYGRTPAQIRAYTLGTPNGILGQPPIPQLTPVNVWVNPDETKVIDTFQPLEHIDNKVLFYARNSGKTLPFYGWVEYIAVIEKPGIGEDGEPPTHTTMFGWDWNAAPSVAQFIVNQSATRYY